WSRPSARSLAKASLVPSGDQAGRRLLPGPRVTWATAPPVGATVWICARPERSDWKASRRPSGDQAGRVSSAGSSVTRVAWPPCATAAGAQRVELQRARRLLRRVEHEHAR